MSGVEGVRGSSSSYFQLWWREAQPKLTNSKLTGIKKFGTHVVTLQASLDFAPGSKWAYSNAGIDTLGRIIEIVSGQTYENFLKARIFNPLRMYDTTFYPTDEQEIRQMFVILAKKLGSRLSPDDVPPIPQRGQLSGADIALWSQFVQAVS